MLKYVVPIYLVVIFVAFCFQSLPGYANAISENPVALLSIAFLGTVLIFLLLLIHIAGIRWKNEGRL